MNLAYFFPYMLLYVILYAKEVEWDYVVFE